MTESSLELGWLQVATACGFAGLSWYLIVRAFPQGLRAFRDDLAAERVAREAQGKAFMDTIRTERQAYDQSLDKIAAAFRRESEDHRALVREMLDRLQAKPTRGEHGSE